MPELWNTTSMPFIASYAGITSPFGIHLPPGGRVAAFVRSTGAQDYDERYVVENLVTTLAAGLAKCRSNRNDTVVVLEGHAENVDATATTAFAANLVAGTRIIGVGKGANRPTFTWTATASNWALGVNNVSVTGCVLDLSGIDAVVAGITVTGTDCELVNNDIVTGSSSKAIVVGVKVHTGADRCKIVGNFFRGLAASEVGSGGSVVQVSAAVKDLLVSGNRFICPGRVTTAEKGIMNVTGAAIQMVIADNLFMNLTASSNYGIVLDNVASSGIVARNMFNVLTDGTAAQQGINFAGSNCLVQAFENYCSGEKGKSGVLTPAAAT